MYTTDVLSRAHVTPFQPYYELQYFKQMFTFNLQFNGLFQMLIKINSARITIQTICIVIKIYLLQRRGKNANHVIGVT